jgi:hypothetical protein
MAIKGQPGQSTTPENNTDKRKFEKKLYVGYAECTVVGINMDKEQMEALGWKVDKDPEYIDTTKDGVDVVTISVLLKEVKTGAYLPLRFSIYDKERAKASTGTYQYLNSLGWEAWAESPEKLKAEFAKHEVRRAKQGEAEFYGFMRKWLRLSGDDAELQFNLNKLWRGNFRELHDVVKSFKDQRVVALATIQSYEKSGQIRQVQSVYSGDFLVADIWGKPMLSFLNADKKPNDIEYFIKNVTKEKYGCKDYYKLELFQEYKPNANPNENQVKQKEPVYTGTSDDLPF